jgi:hypothetical protein
MATRKQKRQQALERRKQFLAELERSNRAALEQEREHRAYKAREAARSKHDKSHSWKKIDPHCILCKDLLAAQKAHPPQLEPSNG